MRIQVLGDDTISQQARTYAEYRIFTALTQLAGAEQVQDAHVVLHRAHGSGDGESATCTVIVTVAGANPVRMRTTGNHPYEAINRAVESLRSAAISERIEWDVVPVAQNLP